MSMDEYLSIQGKIVGRSKGISRKYIQDNFEIANGRFQNKLTEIIQSKTAPIGIASEDPAENSEEFKNYISTNLGFIQEHTTVLGDSGRPDPVRFNDIQAFLINSEHPFIWVKKSRQFGFSFVMAARALAKAILKPKHTSIFVSYNEEESKEKIVYARELYDSMPMKWQLYRKLKYDNKTSLVWEKSGQNSLETRILSYPQRIIRGKGGEIDIGLDEGAHCMHLRKIYTSALPALSRSKTSTLWLGSSPAGKSGLFYEIGINDGGTYPYYVRLNIPWWCIPEFCKDVEAARKVADDLHTHARVDLFATEKIALIKGSMPLDDFRQEYECADLDEQYSYYPWDLINGCVPILNVDAENTPEFTAPAGDLSDGDTNDSGRSGVHHYDNFEDFTEAIRNGIIKGPILGGFDVGRTNDASEIYYIEEHPHTHHQIARCNITMKNVSFPEQRRTVLEQFKTLGSRLIRFGVDNNGIGMNIAEDLEAESYEKVVKLAMNNSAWKEEACRNFKYRMSKRGISFSTRRSILSQIHSIKRILLPSGDWRFDAEKTKKHHGDKFWALLGASIVGHPIDNADQFTSFDERIINAGNESKRRKGPDVIAVANMVTSTSRHSPWGINMPLLPPVPSVMNIGRSMVDGGLSQMGNDLPFNR